MTLCFADPIQYYLQRILLTKNGLKGPEQFIWLGSKWNRGHLWHVTLVQPILKVDSHRPTGRPTEKELNDWDHKVRELFDFRKDSDGPHS